MQNSILKKEESIWRHIVNLEIIMVAIKALEWLSSRSVAEIMDKTSKIGEIFSTHKPQPGVENIPFLNGHHSPADRARELFVSGLNGKRLVV